ncbi:TKL protein kinase [Salpingoeca rosetta]|uniref:TKL protein kinase n=1 Tax=Salpingoeca rosetta (strain ATCC 50818 / BSB-021) TaxID=946362 RepID=F2UGT6_SALR5|nr:TKL protein kinase [Salpingoeca rosetta]EGD75836.1 TKL protein kinase [Salpingoeca rosetta]|eukprot:XP_004991757.1 TKL protein kinase [Salpingoeca rosetta]
MGVCDAYIDALAVALKSNHCLQTLDLSRFWMTADRAITIANALDPHRNITVKFDGENEDVRHAFDKRMNERRQQNTPQPSHPLHAAVAPPSSPGSSAKPSSEIALKKKLQEKNAELSAVQQANAKLQQNLESVQQQLASKTSSLNDADARIAELEQQVTALSEALSNSEDIVKHFESHSQQLAQENAFFKTRVELKDNWEEQLEGVLNLNIPSSRFVGKVRVFDINGKPVGGAFGSLFKAELAGQPVALKQMPVQNRPRLSEIIACVAGSEDVPDHLKQLRREALILLSLRHPNIVHFLGLTHDEQSQTLAFVLSWAENGSLYDLLHVKKQLLDEPTCLRVAFEVACAMAFLHAHNVVHRDLKSPNVLLDASLSAKVTDFGLSTFKSADKSVLTHGGGTPLWASPEQLLEGQELRMDTDVFSFAVLVWELFLNIKPWYHGKYAALGGANISTIARAYEKGRYLPLDVEVDGRRLSDAVQQVLGQCFDVSGNRPSFVQLQGTLGGQYTAAKEQHAVDMEQQHEQLHGPASAAWKWQPNVLEPLQSFMVTHPTRASVRIAAVGAAHDKAIAIANQMITEAGGRSSDEATAAPLQPFGKTVAGVAVVQCSQKNAAFNGAVHRNQTRYRGHMSSANHPFHPKYQMGQATGAPINAEEAAVLARATLHPAGASSYKVLDPAMMQPDVHLRLQRVFHGVPSFAVAMSILGGDFAQLQKTDNGWYGAGFYFTHDLDYALEYTKKCKDVPPELQHLNLPAGKQFRVVLVCDVQYGNPYPVPDAVTFNGKPLVGGHDAHVAVVDFSTGSKADAFPLAPTEWASKRTAAEIVINDPSCVLVRGILVFEA